MQFNSRVVPHWPFVHCNEVHCNDSKTSFWASFWKPLPAKEKAKMFRDDLGLFQNCNLIFRQSLLTWSWLRYDFDLTSMQQIFWNRKKYQKASIVSNIMRVFAKWTASIIWRIWYDSYHMRHVICLLINMRQIMPYITWLIGFTHSNCTHKKSKKVLERSSTEPLKIHHQIKFHVIGCVGVANKGPIKDHHVMLVMFWHWIPSQIKPRDSPVFFVLP